MCLRKKKKGVRRRCLSGEHMKNTDKIKLHATLLRTLFYWVSDHRRKDKSLNYMFCPTANAQKWSSSSFSVFRLFEAIAEHNAWNYNKNSHQDWGKNSLDVIGHTHTSGTVPFTHQAQWRSLRAKLWGQSVCAQSCFFHSIEMCSSMANHLPDWATMLPQACQTQVFTLRRRADTRGNQKMGFFALQLQHCATWTAARGGAEEGKSVRMGLNQLFIPTFYVLNQARHGKTHFRGTSNECIAKTTD